MNFLLLGTRWQCVTSSAVTNLMEVKLSNRTFEVIDGKPFTYADSREHLQAITYNRDGTGLIFRWSVGKPTERIILEAHIRKSYIDGTPHLLIETLAPAGRGFERETGVALTPIHLRWAGERPVSYGRCFTGGKAIGRPVERVVPSGPTVIPPFSSHSSTIESVPVPKAIPAPPPAPALAPPTAAAPAPLSIPEESSFEFGNKQLEEETGEGSLRNLPSMEREQSGVSRLKVSTEPEVAPSIDSPGFVPPLPTPIDVDLNAPPPALDGLGDL